MSQEYLTVTALTKYLKRKFELDPYLERVYLTGEISNFRLRPGHQYFSLKDDRAKISATMFKGAFSKLKFQPKEGMKVLVVGRISLYESNGSYQINIEHMEPDGIGALYQALAELKEKLTKEGLFNAPKKELPRFPEKIAVITSPSGAVIRDIITTVKRRYPIAQLVLFPTVVQGDQAADSIVGNIRWVESIGDFDTMIIGRGGGSIEDLWPFNEERVARAIYEARTPVISSVGHETDVTIADLVADVRAATPTAAAELAVPVLTEEVMKIKEKQTRLEQAYYHQLQRKNERYQRAMNSFIMRQPSRLYEAQAIKLDQLTEQLKRNSKDIYLMKEKELQQAQLRLSKADPTVRVQQLMQQTMYLDQSLQRNMMQYMTNQQQRFQQVIQSLDLLSPLKIMGRGFSYTTKETQVIRSAAALTIGDQINVHFKDGEATATVTETSVKEGN